MPWGWEAVSPNVVEAIVVLYRGRFSMKEIAGFVGESVATIRHILHRECSNEIRAPGVHRKHNRLRAA